MNVWQGGAQNPAAPVPLRSPGGKRVTEPMDLLRRLKFPRHRPKSHRRHFIDAEDVRTVLRRLPPDLWGRLRAVHFNDRAKGSRTLGYVNMAHREIALCAQPHRVSLAGALRRNESPAEF